MIHLMQGVDAHGHETVADARDCENTWAEARAEIAAERANERYFEERGGGHYAGSQEEARDRWNDWMSRPLDADEAGL
jgi:chemotaxis regulatin CheY-phosphate phosphatase CheZ